MSAHDPSRPPIDQHGFAAPQGYGAPEQNTAALQGFGTPPQGYGPPPQGAAPQVGAVPAPPDPRGPVRPEHFPGGISLDGRLPWILGFLAVLGLPFISLLAPGIAMVIAGLLQQRKNPVAAWTGRRAAAFGAVNIVVVALFLAVLFIGSFDSDGGYTAQEDPLVIYGFALPFGIYLVALGPILNLVMAIIALARPVSREKAQRILETTGR